MNTNPGPSPDEKRPPLPAFIRWASIIIALVFLAVLAYSSYRLITYQRAAADRTEAMDNLRSLSTVLLEFDNEYGSYPSAETAAEVKSRTDTHLSFGDQSSNQLLRQLLAGGAGKSEKPFWAKTAISPKRPDDRFDSSAKALGPGECGFAYIAGLSSSSDPDTPVLVTPLLSGKRQFDPVPFRGYAVVLFNNCDRKSYPIDQHGHVLLGGKDIFDPAQPFWHGKAPDIKWPE